MHSAATSPCEDDTRTFEEILDAYTPTGTCMVDYVTSDGRKFVSYDIERVFLTKYLKTVVEGNSLDVFRCFYPFGPFEVTLHARYEQDIVLAVAIAFKDAMASCFADHVAGAIDNFTCDVITTSEGHVLAFSRVHVRPIVQQMIMVRAIPYIRLVIADLQDTVTIQQSTEPYPMRKYLPSPDTPPYAIAFKGEFEHDIIPPWSPPAGGNCLPFALSDIANAQLRTYGPESKTVRRFHIARRVPEETAMDNGILVKCKRGPVSKDTRERIVKEQGDVCAWCESVFHPVHNPHCIDHRGAVCLGGTSERSNLQALCGICHRAKTGMDLKCNSLRKQRLNAQSALPK